MSEEQCCKVNIFKSAADTLKRVVSDPTTVTEEQQSERMEICKVCEFFDPSGVKCNKCGCYLQMKTKFSNMRCPVGKWNEIRN